jgi:hypothetical protein
VLPLIVLAAVTAIVMGTVVAQRMAITTVSKSIADVDAQSRALAPQIERVNRLAQEKAELDLGWVSSPSSKRAVPRAFAPWTSWPAAFRTTCG